ETAQSDPDALLPLLPGAGDRGAQHGVGLGGFENRMSTALEGLLGCHHLRLGPEEKCHCDVPSIRDFCCDSTPTQPCFPLCYSSPGDALPWDLIIGFA